MNYSILMRLLFVVLSQCISQSQFFGLIFRVAGVNLCSRKYGIAVCICIFTTVVLFQYQTVDSVFSFKFPAQEC